MKSLAGLLKDYREVLLHNQRPSVFDISSITGCALVIGAISWYLLRKIDRRVIKDLQVL